MTPSSTADFKLFNAFVQCLPDMITVSIDKLYLLGGNTMLLNKLFALIPAEDRLLSERQLGHYARHLRTFRHKYQTELQVRFRRRAALIHSPDIAVSIQEFRVTQLASRESASQIGHACEHKLISRLEKLCEAEFRTIDGLQTRYRHINKNALPNAINPITLGTSLADSFLRTPFRQQHAQTGLLHLVFLFAHEVRKQLVILSADFNQAMELEEFDSLQHAPRFQPFLPTIPMGFGD